MFRLLSAPPSPAKSRGGGGGAQAVPVTLLPLGGLISITPKLGKEPPPMFEVRGGLWLSSPPALPA